MSDCYILPFIVAVAHLRSLELTNANMLPYHPLARPFALFLLAFSNLFNRFPQFIGGGLS